MAKLHKHLIVHAHVDNPPVKKDERFVEQWLTDIVHAMDMEVLKEASAEYCEQVGNRGMTAGVYITTSHMILHTWDECDQPFIEFDIYTCSDLDPEMAFKALEVFGVKNISYKFLDRYNGLTDLTPVPMARVEKDTAWTSLKKRLNLVKKLFKAS